tara:strand:+ start:176 stop:607 length:432 start_codon:yes stop_codon:yes gene_type:complete
METYYLVTLNEYAYIFCAFLFAVIIPWCFLVKNIAVTKKLYSLIGAMGEEIAEMREQMIELENEKENLMNKMKRQKPGTIPPHIKHSYITSQIGSNAECVLCLENIDSINSSHLTPCGHLFHTECFNKIRMFRNKRQCPTCRS